MARGILAAAAAVVLAAQFAGSAHAGVLWDNGGPAVTNLGGSGMSDTIQATCPAPAPSAMRIPISPVR